MDFLDFGCGGGRRFWFWQWVLWILAISFVVCGCDDGLSCLVVTVGFVDFGYGNGLWLWL